MDDISCLWILQGVFADLQMKKPELSNVLDSSVNFDGNRMFLIVGPYIKMQARSELRQQKILPPGGRQYLFLCAPAAGYSLLEKERINGSPEGSPLAHDIFAGHSPECVIVGYTHSAGMLCNPLHQYRGRR